MAILMVVFTLTGCGQTVTEHVEEESATGAEIQIGMSIDSFVIERWLRDRDVFVSTAQELGAEVNVQCASGDIQEQIDQIKYLIEKKVDVLVVIAVDCNALADVLKEAIKAFDGTAIIVSHDREFLDGLVTKVYEFGGGKVREHLGGIYDFLREHKISELNQLGTLRQATQKAAEPKAEPAEAKGADAATLDKAMSYAERKEQQKRLKRAERAVKESEAKIEKMEARLKELDDLLMKPENASDMTLVTEYTTTKSALDEEVERWEKLSEEMEAITQFN